MTKTQMHRYLVTRYEDGAHYTNVIGAYSLDDAWGIVKDRHNVDSITFLS